MRESPKGLPKRRGVALLPTQGWNGVIDPRVLVTRVNQSERLDCASETYQTPAASRGR